MQQQITSTEGDINLQSWWSAIGLWILIFFVLGPAFGILVALVSGGQLPNHTIMVTINLTSNALIAWILYKINRKALLLFGLTLLATVPLLLFLR